MENSSVRSEQFLRQRKMLLVLPVIFVPMLALAFYGLGGGKGDADGIASGNQKGLNMTLPHPQFDNKAKPMDKLGFYEKAALDSARLKERMKDDPYSNFNPSGRRGRSDTAWIAKITGSLARAKPGINTSITGPDSAGGRMSPNAQADLVLRKLGELKETLGRSKSAFEGGGHSNESGHRGGGDTPGGNNSLERLLGKGVEMPDTASPEWRIRQLLDGAKGSAGGSSDPEIDKLDGMLDKLLKIQHPEEAKRDTNAGLDVPGAGKLEPVRPDNRVGSLDNGDGGQQYSGTESGFMEIGESDASDTGKEVAIRAVINMDQTLTSGSTVALRLLEEATVGGHTLPRNQLLYGLANISGERVIINITSARVGQSIVPVALQVYDLDGLLGIRAQGTISRDVSKQSADEAMSGLELASLDPSLGAQAASAGLQFAKSLASKKIKLVRVSLPSGYEVLLKNSKSNIR